MKSPYLSAPSSGWSPKHGHPGLFGIVRPDPSSATEPSSVTSIETKFQSAGFVRRRRGLRDRDVNVRLAVEEVARVAERQLEDGHEEPLDAPGRSSSADPSGTARRGSARRCGRSRACPVKNTVSDVGPLVRWPEVEYVENVVFTGSTTSPLPTQSPWSGGVSLVWLPLSASRWSLKVTPVKPKAPGFEARDRRDLAGHDPRCVRVVLRPRMVTVGLLARFRPDLVLADRGAWPLGRGGYTDDTEDEDCDRDRDQRSSGRVHALPPSVARYLDARELTKLPRRS